MEKQLAKVVNSGLVGEPQNICLQVQETLKIVPFSTIKFIHQNDESRSVEINDGDFQHTEIQYILNHMGHDVSITWDENEIVTLYF
jgi:hypothetical protein